MEMTPLVPQLLMQKVPEGGCWKGQPVCECPPGREAVLSLTQARDVCWLPDIPASLRKAKCRGLSLWDSGAG